MIAVTRLNRTEMLLNSDLIETIESTPDTVITLINGQKIVVRENSGEVLERIRAFRESFVTGTLVATGDTARGNANGITNGALAAARMTRAE